MSDTRLTQKSDPTKLRKSSDLKENQFSAKQCLQALVLTEVFHSQAFLFTSRGKRPLRATTTPFSGRLKWSIIGPDEDLLVFGKSRKADSETFWNFVSNIEADDQCRHFFNDSGVRKWPTIEAPKPFH